MILSKQEKKQIEEINENKQTTFTIYAYTRNFDKIEEYVQYIFKDKLNNIEKQNNSLLLTFLDNSKMNINFILDKEEIKNRLLGMTNYFLQLKSEEKILKQIKKFNCIIDITVQFNDNEERTEDLRFNIYKLAEKFSIFLLYPNTHFFYNYEKENDKNRRLKSIEILKRKNIPYIENLTNDFYEENVDICSKEDIIRRLIAIFATSIKAEMYISGQYNNCEKVVKQALTELEEKYKVFESFTKEEKAYINGENNNHLKFILGYECCVILLWALSLKELNEPNEICDRRGIDNIIWNSNFNDLLEKSKLKSKDEILDLQDLVFCYNWACIDTIIKNQKLPQLNREIISKWHYTLTWLYGVQYWENIQIYI